MKLLFAVATIVLAVWIESGSAIQCVKCTSNPGQITPGCDDPFDPLITTTDTCEGRCLATKSTSMAGGQTLVEVSRSCVVPDPAAGQDCPAAAICMQQETSTICRYCCDEDSCNSAGFQEMADAVESFPCWTCTAIKQEGVEPASMSCGADDFNGEGDDVTQMPCTTKCASGEFPAGAMGQGSPASYVRMCVPDASMCGQGANCCNGTLCNGPSPGGESGEGDGGDDVKAIKCWNCMNGGEACAKGSFPADGATKIDCPSGKCIKFTNTINSTESTSRTCLLPMMEQQGICDGDHAGFTDVECCEKDLCNTASSVRSVVAIISALLLTAYVGSLQ